MQERDEKKAGLIAMICFLGLFLGIKNATKLSEITFSRKVTFQLGRRLDRFVSTPTDAQTSKNIFEGRNISYSASLVVSDILFYSH